MNKQVGFTLLEITVVLVALIGGFGWVWNIVKLCAMNLDSISGFFIVRCIGIFVPPVGAVVGYL